MTLAEKTARSGVNLLELRTARYIWTVPSSRSVDGLLVSFSDWYGSALHCLRQADVAPEAYRVFHEFCYYLIDIFKTFHNKINVNYLV